MLLGSPDVTPYDLRFRLLDIPVRVHPLFWLVMLLISGHPKDLTAAAVFVACAFVSVLVHELGHGLSGRAVGDEPIGIVLYAMGGFCAFDPGRQSPVQRLLVLISGPGAGFVLLTLVLAAANATYGIAPADAMALIGVGHPNDFRAMIQFLRSTPPLSLHALHALLFINFWWGVLNLLPIWPLDGGQITGVVLGMVNRRDGARWGHVVSLLTAALIALWWASREQYLMAFWFGYFGYVNYQMLQTMYGSYRYGDEGEWWRR
jgi:Zn-dependent protease